MSNENKIIKTSPQGVKYSVESPVVVTTFDVAPAPTQIPSKEELAARTQALAQAGKLK